MLHLVKESASEFIVVTLTEKQTLPEPYFLFIFTHTLTKTVVNKIFSPGDDLSDYPSRYNKFEILTVSLFVDSPIGEWLYEAYEQTSDSNTNPDNATSLLENGKLRLLPVPGEEFEMDAIYNAPTTYKTYNG